MYPIWIRDGKNERPESDVYYILSANGFFLRKKNQFWDVTVPVERISILEETSAMLSLALPPISPDIVASMVRFFAWANNEYGSEVGMLLWYSEEAGYSVSVPKQFASRSRVRYEIPRPSAGERLLGTFHSHADMNAYHSPIDCKDEESFDGIHGTIGNLSSWHRKEFSVSLQGVFNGTRFAVSPQALLGGIVPVDPAVTAESFQEELAGIAALPERKRSMFDDLPFLPRTRFSLFHLADRGPLIRPDYVPPLEWRESVKFVSPGEGWGL